MPSRRRGITLAAGDPRTAATYTFAEAARYLRLPLPTLRDWSSDAGKAAPVFRLDDPERRYLSFMNLVEAHVLAGIRRKHGVSLQQVRSALEYVQRKCGVARPLIDQSFQTDGRFLFIRRLEELINASRGGQLAMPDLLPQLERIEREFSTGLPAKLYPFTRSMDASRPAPDPKLVVMNPLISFGRPSVGGVPTHTIWSRFRAGDSPAHLAEDYGLDPEAIEEAIRCEAA
jgi:uncharacterized protein (DUF433 family)